MTLMRQCLLFRQIKKNVDLGFKGPALKTISERSKHLKLLLLCPNPQSPTWPQSCPNIIKLTNLVKYLNDPCV